MRYVYSYSSQDERQTLINQNSFLFLIEEQNIIDGDFLVFSDEEPERRVVEHVQTTLVLSKDDFDSLQNRLEATEDALLALLLEGGA